jgi:hypothetical protein
MVVAISPITRPMQPAEHYRRSKGIVVLARDGDTLLTDPATITVFPCRGPRGMHPAANTS